ncbi:hypothetical protein EDE15_2239 [Edaphobacter aggregans]|uniref:DoxX-like protein n=1 Tax=Edaphobacter aggregans TaxID=570835 RepID=A0A3R9R2Y7_9BACT|nr:hypothetical protein [Edaphobacter aggregans]RSL16717.1 hypothetical protein EDE15_2239 [Edaphobacter aggregans]
MSKWVLPVGRSLYAFGLASIGLMHFYFKDFPGVIIPVFPAWLPLRLLCVYVVGAALTAAGIAILFDLKGKKVAAWTGVALVVLVLIAHIPNQLSGAYRAVLGAWTNTIKELALAGGAWIAAMSLSKEGELPRWLERALPLGRYFFAFLLIVFGIDHFLYAKFVAMLVPGWVGAPMFWTYFAAVALIAGGLGIVVKRVAWLASLLVGVMIFLWVPMLHIPRAIADPYTNVGNEWASVFEATAFSGMALMLAVLSKSESHSS